MNRAWFTSSNYNKLCVLPSPEWAGNAPRPKSETSCHAFGQGNLSLSQYMISGLGHRQRCSWEVCVKRLAVCTRIGWHFFVLWTLAAITATVLHHRVLSLSDHLKTVSCAQVGKFPLLKSSLSYSISIFFNDFSQMHTCGSQSDCIVNRTLKLSCDWNSDRHWIELASFLCLLSAHWRLK